MDCGPAREDAMGQIERYNQGGIGRRYWDYRDRAVMRHLGERPIIDVGCGEMITTKKMGVWGVDVEGPGLPGSAYDIPFPSEYAGTVTLLEVIEHLDKPWYAIAEIRRVLKPGGRLIVLFPNDRTFKIAWALTGMWGEIGRDRGHLKQWTPGLVEYLLLQSGFYIVDHESIPVNCWALALHHIVVAEKL